MRSLFLKIFLWFWVTQVAVGLSLVITWSMQSEVIVSRWRASTSDAIALYAQTAVEELDRYGPAALGNYLKRLESSARMRTALLDEGGNVISGSVSPQGQELAARIPPGSLPQYALSGREALAAQRASGPSGRTYILVAEMPRGPFGAFRPAARTQAWRFGLAILISGFICYLLTLYLTRPILRLREASTQLAAGNLKARAGPEMEKRRDEIGDLVHDFNLMADRIETLLTTERQLISDISHELRSPLARLSVALGLARQRAGAEAAGPLDRIERETERLNELIGRLLTLARMQAAVEPPERSPVRLDELVRDVASDAAFEAQQHGTGVRISSASECVTQGSPELLRSAVENVVRNAVRYTAPGTEVEIALECARDGMAEIRVRDHGPGVPEYELANLFRPFYRLTSARERQTGGTGLGLAIAERAVRLHKGTVTASNAPGGGLQVDISLPASVVGLRE
ncbi:MAG: ATP-binding protein [Terriglobales bacterium]